MTQLQRNPPAVSRQNYRRDPKQQTGSLITPPQPWAPSPPCKTRRVGLSQHNHSPKEQIKAPKTHDALTARLRKRMQLPAAFPRTEIQVGINNFPSHSGRGERTTSRASRSNSGNPAVGKSVFSEVFHSSSSAWRASPQARGLRGGV